MPKSYTSNFREKTGSTSGQEPLYLLEIMHPQLAVPARVVRDTQDIVSGGNTFVACGFDIRLPEDLSGQLPRAQLLIDNIGRELTQWIDASKGGKGATARVTQVMRATPNTLEFDATLDLINVRQNGAHVVGELGYEDTLNLPALAESYRPDNTPGIF